jgi:hypothetical protein
MRGTARTFPQDFRPDPRGSGGDLDVSREPVRRVGDFNFNIRRAAARPGRRRGALLARPSPLLCRAPRGLGVVVVVRDSSPFSRRVARLAIIHWPNGLAIRFSRRIRCA